MEGINGLFEDGWGSKQVDSAVVSRAGVESPGVRFRRAQSRKRGGWS